MKPTDEEPDATKIVAANALSQLGWRATGE